MEFFRGCMTCNYTFRCVIEDDIKGILWKMQRTDVLVFATPIYYSISGQLKTFFNRLDRAAIRLPCCARSYLLNSKYANNIPQCFLQNQ